MDGGTAGADMSLMRTIAATCYVATLILGVVLGIDNAVGAFYLSGLAVIGIEMFAVLFCYTYGLWQRETDPPIRVPQGAWGICEGDPPPRLTP